MAISVSAVDPVERTRDAAATGRRVSPRRSLGCYTRPPTRARYVKDFSTPSTSPSDLASATTAAFFISLSAPAASPHSAPPCMLLALPPRPAPPRPFSLLPPPCPGSFFVAPPLHPPPARSTPSPASRPSLWSNFEIADLALWRAPAYTDFSRISIRRAGFIMSEKGCAVGLHAGRSLPSGPLLSSVLPPPSFLHPPSSLLSRWGHAPVHSIAAGLFASKDQIQRSGTSTTRTPTAEGPGHVGAREVRVRPAAEFDYDGYSCMRQWDKFMGL
ncbi:hypothetical protein B0H17DRAFT_1333838 [Mycena rosella]|uniref:Uncharacterized protein n=1 Tax=Mycena rosella TaxID=1033263 RepID=A0AAD7D604_MYCRO|nr:hypothetical protein B0H17DRAFT_1333838 [Mycena rosella]